MILFDRIYHKYQERLDDFLYDIKTNISKELVNDDNKCKEHRDDIHFFFKMPDDNKLYNKFIDYLSSKRIWYEVYNDADGSKMIEIEYDQFYKEAYDNVIQTISNSVDRFLADINALSKKYRIYVNKYNVIFIFYMQSDNELYNKLKRYLEDKKIMYTENMYDQINVIEIFNIDLTYFLKYRGSNES
jgi:hypothetical protein